MCVTITWELSGIVYSEVRSTKVLQLFSCGSDTPATDPVIHLVQITNNLSAAAKPYAALSDFSHNNIKEYIMIQDTDSHFQRKLQKLIWLGL